MDKEQLNKKLLKSAAIGDLAGVSQALTKGADINTQDENGYTALMYAAYYGQKEVLLHLLKNSADTSLKEKLRAENCLDLAIGNHNDIAELLIDRGMSLDDCRHIVDYAAGGYTACVEFLLDHGVDVNARLTSGDGSTAIMEARDIEVAELLLRRGADLSLTNNNGLTVLDKVAHLDDVYDMKLP